MQFMGQVLRYTPMKDTARRDQYFHEFVQSRAINYTEKYRMAMPNREAMTISISKYNRPQPTELNDKAWDIAVDWAEKHFRPHIGSTFVVDHDRARRDLDRTTSPGYPWSRFWSNKGQFLDSEEAPKVEKIFWDSLTTDKPLKAFWTASLKRELRPVEKLVENKIRTFTASPTELSVATTRMCLDFNEKFYESNNKTWSFVGCSKFYQGFDRLYRRLNKHPNAFELDESSFDASLFRRAMYSARDLRWRMLHDIEKTPENKKRLWEIYEQIVNSIIVLDNGEVFQKNTGNPSGSANTIVDNTLILFMLFAYAFIMLALEYAPEFATFECFMELVEAALNGDDNTFTVSNKIISWFNAENVARIWKLLGVETKSPDFKPRKLSECEFLSHSFKKLHGMWLPMPERDKALCSLMWGSEVDDVRFTLLRAYALRIETWPDEQARSDIMLFITYLRKEFRFDLHGTIPDTDLTMLRIESVFKTDEELRRLYTLPPVLEGKRKFLQLPSLYAGGRSWEGPFKSNAEKVISEIEQLFPFVDVAVKPQVERNRNVHADSMAPARGKGKKGGNPSKAEMQRRMRQSQQDKARARRKQAPQNRPKAPKQEGFKTVQTKKAPLASGRRQVNVSATKTREHKHTTFIGAFTTGTDGKFTDMVSFPFNPAQQSCDPWGFPIAGRFESYSTKRGVAPFRVRVEPRNAATVAGETFVSIQYNADAAAPTSSQQLLQHSRASRSNAWMKNAIVCEYDAARQKNRYYCRPGAQPSGTDIREYDMCNVYVFYEGISTALTFDVFIDIDILLHDPWIPQDGELPNVGDYENGKQVFDGANMGPYTKVTGNGALTYVKNTTLSANPVSIVFTTPGYYAIAYNWVAVGGTYTLNPNMAHGAGCSWITGYYGRDASAIFNSHTGGNAVSMGVVHVPQLAINGGTGYVTATNPTGMGANDIASYSVQFMAWDDGQADVPSLASKKRERVTAEGKIIETQIAYLMSLTSDLKRMIDRRTVLTAEEPKTPEPSTSAAAGGKPLAPPLSLGTDSKDSKETPKSDVRGTGKKSK